MAATYIECSRARLFKVMVLTAPGDIRGDSYRKLSLSKGTLAKGIVRNSAALSSLTTLRKVLV